jgi:hypothetical protein
MDVFEGRRILYQMDQMRKGKTFEESIIVKEPRLI